VTGAFALGENRQSAPSTRSAEALIKKETPPMRGFFFANAEALR